MKPSSNGWPSYSSELRVSAPARLFGRPSQPPRHHTFRRYRRQVIVRAQPKRKADPKNSKPDNKPEFATAQADYQWGSSRLQKNYEGFATKEPRALMRLATTKQWLNESTGLQKSVAWLLHRLACASWHYLMKGKTEMYKGDLKLKTLKADKELKIADLELKIADLKLKRLQLAVQTAEQVHSPQTSASDTDHAPSSQDTAEHNTVDLSGQLFAQLSAEEDKLPHARASMSAIPALLESALFVALTRSLFGINFLQQWIWPQTWSSWVAFTAVYLVSLVGIESSAGEGRRGPNMQQLSWFPPARAQPGFTPPTETRQSYMRELAGLDLKQASQFAAVQAFITSLVWRGILLVLVHTVLHGSATGAEGMYGDGIRSLSRAGLVALPSWTQLRSILEVAAITAGIEAVMHELAVVAEESLYCGACLMPSVRKAKRAG
ncbi:hypothetical protein ABBQ38_002326 [Trebouxia sp. C0009 RCD-2024]